MPLATLFDARFEIMNIAAPPYRYSINKRGKGYPHISLWHNPDQVDTINRFLNHNYNKMTDYSDDDAMSMASGVAAFESREFSKSMRLLNPFAEQGDAEAQYRVAIMQQNGLGIVKDEARGRKMMQGAAEQGHALAQHGLGFMYLEGECIEQDGEKAIEWFSKAAEQGMIGSATTMAMMYEQGNIVPQDLERAKHWYGLAGFDDKVEALS